MANKDYTTLTAQELKDQAKARKIKNWWLLKKAELIEALTALDKLEEAERAAKEAEVKPAEKKAEKKAPKKEKKSSENIVTLKELAVTYGIKGSKARRLLREAKVERPFKRWEWDQEEHHDILTQVKVLLGGGTEEE